MKFSRAALLLPLVPWTQSSCATATSVDGSSSPGLSKLALEGDRPPASAPREWSTIGPSEAAGPAMEEPGLHTRGLLLGQEAAGERPPPEPGAPSATPPLQSSDEQFFLPFFGDAAREKGYKLPLPLGTGVNFMFINRPTKVSGVKAGVNNGGLNDVNFLTFDATASVSTAIARFDAWVLPMVNVYLLGGYIWNESTVRMTVDLPGAPGTPLTSVGSLEGPTYGGGVTIAGGYKEFFATLDYNQTRSELGNLSEFVARLTSLRLGWNTTIDGADFRLWTGATYWDTKRTISGSILTGGGPIQSIQFAVDQEPVDPVTIVLGTTITLSDRLWFLIEYGAWEGTQALIAGFTLRY